MSLNDIAFGSHTVRDLVWRSWLAAEKVGPFSRKVASEFHLTLDVLQLPNADSYVLRLPFLLLSVASETLTSLFGSLETSFTAFENICAATLAYRVCLKPVRKLILLSFFIVFLTH